MHYVKLGRKPLDVGGVGHHWAVRVQIRDSSGDWFEINYHRKEKTNFIKKGYRWSAESGAGALGGTIFGKTTKTNEDIELSKICH